MVIRMVAQRADAGQRYQLEDGTHRAITQECGHRNVGYTTTRNGPLHDRTALRPDATGRITLRSRSSRFPTKSTVSISDRVTSSSEFLAFSPNDTFLRLLITTGLMVGRQAFSRSGAILVYLAEKTGKLLPGLAPPKTVMERLMWQMGLVRCLGRHHFIFYAKDKIDYAVTRYGNEATVFTVFDRNSRGGNMWPTSSPSPICDFPMDAHL